MHLDFTFADGLEIETWDSIKPYFEDLLTRETETFDALQAWLCDRSKLEGLVSENFAWRYIRMNGDTTDEQLKERFEIFVTQIQPELQRVSDQLDRKLLASQALAELEKQFEYQIYLRSVRNRVELYRAENVPLMVELEQLEQKFGEISGAQTIEHDGQTLTMPQAGKLLQSPDRSLRKTVYDKVVARRAEDRERLDELLDELLELRNQIAHNANCQNYVEYIWKAKERFDYTVDQVRDFHAAVKQSVVPLVRQMMQRQAKLMKVEKLAPYDTSCDPLGREPLRPFEGGGALLDGTKQVFGQMRLFYRECLEVMEQKGHFDLESRTGKAPGGFMYPLYEDGYPFIYMNAAGTQSDIETMVHEGGHAIHSVLAHRLPLVEMRSTPSETAELASMSMEFMSMGEWSVFYENSEDLKRAQLEKIEDGAMSLPWIAQVDEFQLWLYENPSHSPFERRDKWVQLCEEYGTGVVDHTGYEAAQAHRWQSQLHIYEVPMYYIEYGMAQLGAVAMWRNYQLDPEQTLDAYESFMKLGHTRGIPEIYRTAGVSFDFSAEYVTELMNFLQTQWQELC